jgi:hypothetical protein
MTTRQIVADCRVGTLLLAAASQPLDVIHFSWARALSDGFLLFELMQTVDVHTMVLRYLGPVNGYAVDVVLPLPCEQAMNLAINTLIYVTIPAGFTVESPSGPLAEIAGRTRDAAQALLPAGFVFAGVPPPPPTLDALLNAFVQ